MDFNFSFVYSTLVGAVVGGAVVWVVVKALAEKKVRLLRRIDRDTRSVASMSAGDTEAVKRAAEENKLEQDIKETTAKW